MGYGFNSDKSKCSLSTVHRKRITVPSADQHATWGDMLNAILAAITQLVGTDYEKFIGVRFATPFQNVINAMYRVQS